MKCPSCATVLEAPVPRCPTCKLSLQRLDAKFGLVPRHSRYLSDRSGKLDLAAMQSVREALRLFETKFPQVLFSVFVTDLPRGTSVSEYAFWLANRARFNTVHKTQAENFDLLLVIDLLGNAAALNVGYGLEKYVSEADLETALVHLRNGMEKEGIIAGIHACVEFVTRRFRELSLEARRGQSSLVETAP